MFKEQRVKGVAGSVIGRRPRGGLSFSARVSGLRMFLLLLTAIALFIIFPLTLSFSLYSLSYQRYSMEEIANTAELNVISARKMTEMFQDTIIQAATLVLMDPILGQIASIKRLDEVRGSFDTYQRLSRAVSLLTSMTYIGSLRIDSAYFYADGADYIITSDQGAIRLGNFAGKGYRAVFDTLARNPHTSVWTVREIPITTISGDTEQVDYLTYANMTNPVISRVRGAIFLNIRETVFFSLINTKEFDKGGHTFVVDEDGAVLSHVDKTRILKNVSESADTAWLAGERGSLPKTVFEGGGSLFVTAYSTKTSWTFVSQHSLSALTAKIRGLMRTSILVIFIIVLVGTGVVLYISTRISIPLRKLIRSLSQWNPGGSDRGMIRNEFEYLLDSFQRIQEHQGMLHKTIDDSRDKLWESYIVDLLRGDRDKYIEDPFPRSQIVPEGGVFRVLTIAFDRRSDVESRFSQEQRLSFLSLLSVECEKIFAPDARCIAVRIDGNVSAILGAAEEDGVAADRITPSVHRIQEQFAPMLGSTLTAGISDRHGEDLAEVSRAYDESLEALTRRIVEGHGKIHLWEPAPSSPLRYPYEVETMLMNHLRTGDFRGAESALGTLFSMLGERPCDDILHSVEQLCAVLARFMRDNNVKRTSAGSRGIFDELRNRETLWEMKGFLAEVCRIIAAETGTGAAVLVERILDYVRARFTTTIDFGAMADHVGISYSYMRRLMREYTGRSILDHIHSLRIEEAGRLLANREQSISAIAKNLGYNNIQSFERFFKKHKGVSAHEYRELTKEGATGQPRYQIR